MRITVLSGGAGGARFLHGLRSAVNADTDSITVVGNTADDIWMFGLRICPDLDTVMYTLGDGLDTARGWGRRDETWNAQEELAAYGAEPTWFGLGDRDLATHIFRTHLLNTGHRLSEVTQALCERWRPGVRLIPMTDDQVETHVVIDDPAHESGERTVHFQEYWVRLRAPNARGITFVGADDSKPAPGTIEAIVDAEVLIVAPSNPVVSVGTILSVPGIAEAVRGTAAKVVGVSPIIGGAPVRGMADKLLPAIGVEVTASAVATHYGARQGGGLLDGWLVDDCDSDSVPVLEKLGMTARAAPLYMRDRETTQAVARSTLTLAHEVAHNVNRLV